MSACAMCDSRSRAPICVLQNDPVAVWIFERFSLDVPVRIEWRDGRIAEPLKLLRGFLPLRAIGNVKHQKVVLTRRFPGMMAAFARELQVISRCLVTEHDTIEAVVILKFLEHFETEALTINFTTAAS